MSGTQGSLVDIFKHPNLVAFFEYHAIACTLEKDRMVALMTFANTVDEDFLNDQSTLSVPLAAGHFGAAGCQHDGLASPTALAMAGIAGVVQNSAVEAAGAVRRRQLQQVRSPPSSRAEQSAVQHTATALA